MRRSVMVTNGRNLALWTKQRAFNLIELLVVVAIVAILAALLLPVLSTVNRTTDRVRCSSNLRAIGGAISAYMVDNDNLFPGPCYGAQHMYSSSDSMVFLAPLLATYLGYPAPNKTPVLIKEFACPAWLRQAKPTSTTTCPSYVRNSGLIGAGGTPFDFCGYPGTSPTPPIRITQVSALSGGQVKSLYAAASYYICSLSSVWFLTDIDQQNPLVPGAYYGTPSQPIHGKFRVKLFLDWHVEAVPVVTGSD